MEVAEILGVSKKSVYNMCANGTFKCVRIGTRLRISKKAFDDWLDGRDNTWKEPWAMASIQKRGKKYAVVYTYTDSADVKRQKWETYGTK